MVITREAKIYQPFYTKSPEIVDYMVNTLSLNHNDRILEPCGGDGVFIEAILQHNQKAKIDVYELNDNAINILNKKFSSYPNISIHHGNTLLNEDLILRENLGIGYDKIVANPPYGAWIDYNQRHTLRKLFPKLYTKESYTLFLYKCINLLNNGGILSFIIPDTFLYLRSHKAIRRYILTKTKILNLDIFPSSLFPNVNFGYANLSIITLQKDNNQQECLSHSFCVRRGFNRVDQLSGTTSSLLDEQNLKQADIADNFDCAFFIEKNSQILKYIHETQHNIGNIADCVTGFYSGNDKEFLRVIDHDIKNGKKYQIVDATRIHLTKSPNILNGIPSEKCFIPIVKGGNTKYFKKDIWFMDWSSHAVTHYKSSLKARFQNSNFYFKAGIAVPMVKSKNITASLMDGKLFDQSIVGIFPKNTALTYYLLAFLNSPTCSRLINIINPSANNSANYIKRIPFIEPDLYTLRQINQLVQDIIDSVKVTGELNHEAEKEVHGIFSRLYGF